MFFFFFVLISFSYFKQGPLNYKVMQIHQSGELQYKCFGIKGKCFYRCSQVGLYVCFVFGWKPKHASVTVFLCTLKMYCDFNSKRL